MDEVFNISQSVVVPSNAIFGIAQEVYIANSWIFGIIQECGVDPETIKDFNIIQESYIENTENMIKRTRI